MRLGRRASQEEEAWRQVAALWDASIGELKTKVDRELKALANEEQEQTDDQR